MSQENVEIVRRGFEAFNRGDIEAMLESFDPAVEWHTATDFPNRRVYSGHDGVVALMWEWANLAEGVRADVEEFIDRGEYVVVPVVFRGRIPGSPESDPEVTHRRINLYRCREAKCVEVREYLTLAQGIAATGLRE